MIIVNFEQFIKLPSGTIYCETEPCWFGELKVKYETINDNDWYLSGFRCLKQDEDNWLQIHELYEKLENGESLNIDLDTLERDAMYDKNRKFLIYEKKDIESMLNLFQKLLK